MFVIVSPRKMPFHHALQKFTLFQNTLSYWIDHSMIQEKKELIFIRVFDMIFAYTAYSTYEYIWQIVILLYNQN